MLKNIENALASNDLRDRKNALRQLARSGMDNAKALALVTGKLDDKNANVRAEALQAAIQLAPQNTDALLQKKLLDSHSIVITCAIQIIREKGLKKFIRDLAGLVLYESHKHVRRTALQALIQMEPDTARSILNDFLDIQLNDDFKKRSTWLPKGNPRRTILDNVMLALEIAEEWGDPDLITTVMTFLDRCSPQKIFLFPQYKMFHRDYIRRALLAIARHDQEAACSMVQRFPWVLRNSDRIGLDIDQQKDDAVRDEIMACTPLLQMSADDLIHMDKNDREKAMRAALIMIHSKKSSSQAAAACYYRYVGDPQLTEILLPYFPSPYKYWTRDQKDIISNAAFLDFRRIFHKIIVYLIACSGWKQRVFLARLLGKLEIPQNIHLLVPLALGHSRRDKNRFYYTVETSAGRVQEQIQARKSIISLAKIKNGGLEQILELLRRRHPAIQKLAIEILVELGEPRAVRHLAALINHIDLDIAEAAKSAIKSLRTEHHEKESRPQMTYSEYLRKKRPALTLSEFCRKYNYRITGNLNSPTCLLIELDNTRDESGMNFQYGKIGELMYKFILPGGLIIFQWDATEVVSLRTWKLMPYIVRSRDYIIERKITLHGIDNHDDNLEYKLVHSDLGIINNLKKFSCIYMIVDAGFIPSVRIELDKLGIGHAAIQVGQRKHL